MAQKLDLIFHFPFPSLIGHFGPHFRGASCLFVDRSLGRAIQNDPRSHTNGHEQEVKNGKCKMRNDNGK